LASQALHGHDRQQALRFLPVSNKGHRDTERKNLTFSFPRGLQKNIFRLSPKKETPTRGCPQEDAEKWKAEEALGAFAISPGEPFEKIANLNSPQPSVAQRAQRDWLPVATGCFNA
jgi:hypothetical protein